MLQTFLLDTFLLLFYNAEYAKNMLKTLSNNICRTTGLSYKWYVPFCGP